MSNVVKIFTLNKMESLTYHFLQEFMMKKKRILSVITFLMILPLLSGCWTLVAAGAGAYGGYKMKENGYTLQNPITKEKSKKSSQ